MTLEQLLTETGLNQSQLAVRLGIRQPSVSAWGKRGIPVGQVKQIEKLFGIPRQKLRPDLFG